MTDYISFSEAAHAITDYIVGYYNELRPHEHEYEYEYDGGLPPFWKATERFIYR